MFDFSKDLSLNGYQQVFEKIKDLDISVLINNAGVITFENFQNIKVEAVMEQIAVNCYPIVMLTKVLLDKLKTRYSKEKKKSIIINVSSLSALAPASLY